MNRYLSILTVAFLCNFSCESPKVEEPNVIFILADDLGYSDLSCYGQSKFSTPNIDRLASEGMLFTQHYAGSSICAPSRSTLLTGLHTGHTPIRGNKEVYPVGQYPLSDSVFTVSKLFKQEGYKTGVFGKWGMGYLDTEGDPNAQGFDEFFGYYCQRVAHSYYPEYLWHNSDKVVLNGNSKGQHGTYSPYLIQQKALEFVEENKDSPFFLYYASTLPHAEMLVPEDRLIQYRGRYDPEKKFVGADSKKGPTKIGAYSSQPEGHAAFAAMIEVLDTQVGEILNKLDELGISKNTIVIFTSDNGPHLEGGADPDYFDSNGHLKGYKRDMYEGGIRVPMLVRWPGIIEPNTKSDHVSAFWDFLPTVRELLDYKPSIESDGISYLPTLLGAKQEEHDFLYWELNVRNNPVQAIRHKRWKGVKFHETPIELYDLETDIEEENNVANEYPEIARKLSEAMDSLRTENAVFPIYPEYEN